MCDHRFLDDADGLLCVRADEHDNGHVYAASAGADLETVTHVEMGDQ
jgi:hypothetical protein